METPPPTTSDDRARGAELCTQCGLCCAGALHDTAKLDEDEVLFAKELGLPVAKLEPPCFVLPCPKLSGTICSIYPTRPRTCDRYRCGLLQQLDAGDVDFDSARAKVEIAHGLVRRLLDVMPGGMTVPAARAQALQKVPGETPNQLQLRLAATALVVYIDRNFRNLREGSLLQLNPVEKTGKVESEKR